MIFKHADYLNYDLPEGWCAEEKDEVLLVYNPNGEGAMTISFYSIVESNKSLDEHISIMAKKFIDNNKITLHMPLILQGAGETKIILCGSGTTLDNWFVKLWVVSKYPKIVFATYQCEKESSEVTEYDNIISSMQFLI